MGVVVVVRVCIRRGSVVDTKRSDDGKELHQACHKVSKLIRDKGRHQEQENRRRDHTSLRGRWHKCRRSREPLLIGRSSQRQQVKQSIEETEYLGQELGHVVKNSANADADNTNKGDEEPKEGVVRSNQDVMPMKVDARGSRVRLLEKLAKSRK